MQGLIGISILIHIVLLMHIAGIYRSEALTFIELTVQDMTKPVGRTIPRPRIMNQTPEVTRVENIRIAKQQPIPSINMDTVSEVSPSNLTEQIAVPNIPGFSGNISQWQPVGIAGASQYLSREDYYDMLLLKVESRKTYPRSARNRQIQGSVDVGFTLETDGNVSNLKIVKTSRHPELDQAALDAVKNASPFPRPPLGLFSGPKKMTIKIQFELM